MIELKHIHVPLLVAELPVISSPFFVSILVTAYCVTLQCRQAVASKFDFSHFAKKKEFARTIIAAEEYFLGKLFLLRIHSILSLHLILSDPSVIRSK